MRSQNITALNKNLEKWCKVTENTKKISQLRSKDQKLYDSEHQTNGVPALESLSRKRKTDIYG